MHDERHGIEQYHEININQISAVGRTRLRSPSCLVDLRYTDDKGSETEKLGVLKAGKYCFSVRSCEPDLDSFPCTECLSTALNKRVSNIRYSCSTRTYDVLANGRALAELTSLARIHELPILTGH